MSQNDYFYDKDFDRSLMEQILKSAINDLLAYNPRREEYECSMAWLFDDTEEGIEDEIENSKNGFISLFMVCDILELNCEQLRVLIKCKEDQGKRRLVDSQFKEMLNSCRR